MANKKLPRQIHPKAADDRQYKDVMLKLKSVSGASSSNVVKKLAVVGALIKWSR
jgi:hypothetical protein